MSTASATAAVPAGERSGAGRLGTILRATLPVATVIVVLAGVLLLLFLPLYMHPALDAAGSAQVLGVSREQAHGLSDRTVQELFAGPGTFAFSGPDGQAFYGADEAAHLRDVRVVLFGFLALAGVAAVVLAGSLAVNWHRSWAWRAMSCGGSVLVIGLLAIGAFALLAFDLVFELFHRLFFPGGNWAFDPASQRLVQLYPLAFWQLTSAALGVLGLLGGGLLWLIGRRRAMALDGERPVEGKA